MASAEGPEQAQTLLFPALMRTWRLFWVFYRLQANQAGQGSPLWAGPALGRPMNTKDGRRQRAVQHSALQAKAQRFGIQPCPSPPGIISSLNPPRTFSNLKRSEAGMQDLNSTDIPSPVGPRFPSCSHSGAGSQAPCPATRLAMSILGGRGSYLMPAAHGRCGAGLS